MEQVSDRHAGTLNGLLDAFDPDKAMTVRVRIDPEHAGAAAVQHTAWMILNLLARADGIVNRIHLECPAAVSVDDRVVPFGDDADLSNRLLQGVRAIGVVAISDDMETRVDRTVIVGPAAARENDTGAIWAIGAGWWGGVDRRVRESWGVLDFDHPIPFGSYMAACFAAGDIFLNVRDPGYATRIGDIAYGWNLWSDTAETAPHDLGPTKMDVDLSGIALAGVGAVGAAWMHALWPVPGLTGSILIADSDKAGVSTSNLNRGLLFTAADINHPKATTASNAARGPLGWSPVVGPIRADHIRGRLLISAVDTNSSRDVIQSMYAPRYISGSTRNLRAEVTVGGHPGIGACLRCFNLPEPELSDQKVRALLADDTSTEVQALAAELGADVADLRLRVNSGACDSVTDRYMNALRDRYGDTAGTHRFAVGFVSAAAGVLLATTTIKYLKGDLRAPDGPSRRQVLQFQRPAAASNGVGDYARDQACPRCGPNPAMPVWLERYEAWPPGAQA